MIIPHTPKTINSDAAVTLRASKTAKQEICFSYCPSVCLSVTVCLCVCLSAQKLKNYRSRI